MVEFFFSLVADLRAAFAKKVQKTNAVIQQFECDGLTPTQKQSFVGMLR